MSNLAERVEALERKANSLRRLVLVLSAALVSVAIAGACAASGPRELTLRKLTIEDDNGKPRIVADTDSEGGIAALLFLDRNGKMRIDAGTASNGSAAISFVDRDGKHRINAFTDSNGRAALEIGDRNEKRRISAATLPDGGSSIGVFDSNGQGTWNQGSE
jgi:hypothetical protein